MFRSFRRAVTPLRLALLAGTAISGLAASADAQAESSNNYNGFDEITVSAEREPTKLWDTPSTVSVKKSGDIDAKQIKRPQDLVFDEPGVAVGNQPTRTGTTNYVIRGIGENRVRLQIDGVEIPDAPSILIGPGTYTRDYVDFDSLKSVEIVRGPASALYGSDAIGGVVSFVTKDPSDFLRIFEKDWYIGFKAAYDSADHSIAGTTTVAGRSGPVEGMVIYTRRVGEELRPNGSMKPNPQDQTLDNVLAKFVFGTPDTGIAKLTFESFHKRTTTEILTDRVIGTTSVFDSDGIDTTDRKRVSLEWSKTIDQWFADDVKANVFYTGVDRTEISKQYRGVSGATSPNRYRWTSGAFHQDIVGADAQASLSRTFWGFDHDLTYGASFTSTETSRLRKRTETNLTTGTTTNVIAGETYPNKQFPDTRTTKAAAYVQDVARYGAFRLIPAVRFDVYHLDPQPDQAFAAGNAAGFKVKEQTEFAISPKLGATYDLNDQLRLVAQYAHGFRAPPYDNANFAYSNPLYGYEILPNGNLKPETSDGFEAGLRGKLDDGSSFQLTGFYNLYRDFIDTEIVGTSSGGLIQYQYRNVNRVTIKGAEARGEWKVRKDWSLFGAVAYAYGTNEETHKGIDSVDPLTAVAALRWSPDESWRLEARIKGVAGKDRVSDPTVFKPGGYSVVDAFASWEPNKNFSLNFGVMNIFDRSYFNARDVAGLLATNTQLELYRSPGRTFAVNATVRF